MKKNDVIISVSALLFSGLFYKQSPGLNYLLFTILVSTSLLLLNPAKLKNKTWWSYCGCMLLTGLAVFTINSALSVLACSLSLLVLSSKTLNQTNSIFVNVLFSIYSMLSSFVLSLLEWIEHNKQQASAGMAKKKKIIISVSIALLTTLLFFYLYRLSNPLFDKFARNIDLNWISVGWLFFTLFGFFIMYGLLKSRSVEFISKTDAMAYRDVENTITAEKTDNESMVIIACTLFALLNVMLLFINVFDVNNIYINGKLPQGITLSDFVHESVWSTVFTILIAVSLIAWFFKGDLNFDIHNKKIKLLVYAWIVQSAVVVINTMVRNYWYIQEYQLTHLRIGVYVFLLLSLVGLLLTYVKVAKHKSAWHLATRNFEVWFALLVVASLINWDKTITVYNIEHASGSKKLDVHYLIQLSDANIPELMGIYKNASLDEEERTMIYNKLMAAHIKDRYTQWQSFNLRMQQNSKWTSFPAMYR